MFRWYICTAEVVATWDDIETSVCLFFSVLTQSRAAGTMVEVFVDGKPVEVEAGTTVLQVNDGNLQHVCRRIGTVLYGCLGSCSASCNVILMPSA